MKSFNRVLFVFFVTLSCTDDEQQTNPNLPVLEPAITEIGVPTGDAVTKEIGPSGGTLSSSDGILDITVPPGAVSTNNIFSVLPITNFCPGGMFAYRLLPEGLAFTNPVTLVFHYNNEDISGTLPELLGVAYQGTDKIWYALPDVVLDEGAKTVSVQVKHFTDWTAVDYLSIYPKIPEVIELRVNKTKTLTIIGQGMHDGEEDDLPPLPPNPNPAPPCVDCDELPPLPKPRPFKAEFFVNGIKGGNDNVGRITAESYTGGALQYTYKAPATVPAGNPVLVTAEITGLKRWTIEGGKLRVSRKNKVVLFKQIKIKPDEYHYSLKVEDRVGVGITATGDQSYYDAVELDVHVKDETVSVDNIINRVPTIAPGSVKVIECTYTVDPGPTGTLNVVSGSGTVKKSARVFSVTLEHQGLLNGTTLTISCPGIAPIVTPAQSVDGESYYEFVLADSAQLGTLPGITDYVVKLTPK